MKQQHEMDDSLRRWAAAHRVDEGKVAALRETVRQRLAGERLLHVPQPVPAQRWVLAACAAAAALLAVAVMNRRAPENAGPLQPHFAEISAKDVKSRTGLFQAVSDLFGARLAWLDLSPRGLNISLAENGESTGNPMLVRVWVVRREAGGGNWQTVCEREVIARDQELVDIRGDNGIKEMQFWAIEAADGSMLVESEVVLAVPGAHGNNTVVLRAGQTREVLSFRVDGTEYRVYQAVRRLAVDDRPSSGGRTS
jgi:hypothetical protein